MEQLQKDFLFSNLPMALGYFFVEIFHIIIFNIIIKCF